MIYLIFSFFGRDDFKDYSDLLFKEFGDSTKLNYHKWTKNFITIWFWKWLGSTRKVFPPKPFCTVGNSSTEPYIAAHNLIFAHATVYRLYRETYEVRKMTFLINLLTFFSSSHVRSLRGFCFIGKTKRYYWYCPKFKLLWNLFKFIRWWSCSY